MYDNILFSLEWCRQPNDEELSNWCSPTGSKNFITRVKKMGATLHIYYVQCQNVNDKNKRTNYTQKWRNQNTKHIISKRSKRGGKNGGAQWPSHQKPRRIDLYKGSLSWKQVRIYGRVWGDTINIKQAHREYGWTSTSSLADEHELNVQQLYHKEG